MSKKNKYFSSTNRQFEYSFICTKLIMYFLMMALLASYSLTNIRLTAQEEINGMNSNVIGPVYNENEDIKIPQWEEIAEGLSYMIAEAPLICNFGDSKIRIVRINPRYFFFKLISYQEMKLSSPMTAKEYCDSFGLLAAINSSMFQYQGLSVGYMKNFAYVNNSHINRNNSIIAFNPMSDSLSQFKIIDRVCEDWEYWKDQYSTFIQNIRMIDCNRMNRWTKQEKFWSTACIGTDSQENVLIIHCRSPYRVHDLINMLLKLPIDIQRACYLEGGPESSLYLNHNGVEIESFGSYETGFNSNDNNTRFWDVPNVIGIIEK